MKGLKDYQKAILNDILSKDYQKLTTLIRSTGKPTLMAQILKYQQGNKTVFTKIFKRNKKVRKTIVVNCHISEFQLLIYNRNNKLCHQKHSLRAILKYLKKNLTPDEML